MELEDWDLADTEKFPHLAIKQLMHCVVHTTTRMTALELGKWLKGVEKAGLLNPLWVPHNNYTPITVLGIKQLLYLVHDGCLWLEEPIPITVGLIHRISLLPYKGRDPMQIATRRSDLVLMEAMKTKYKLEKKKRGYVIASIKDRGLCITTQLLAGKVMRKCRADEVLVPMVALVE